MDLIIINGYTPPSPNKYDVDFKNINGANEQLENGYSYIEQTRTQVPNISLAWNNIVETDAVAILNAVNLATFPCKYFFGELKEDIFKCSSPKLTLKLVDGDTRYYDLSLKLEG
jgi:hypothetical protein